MTNDSTSGITSVTINSPIVSINRIANTPKLCGHCLRSYWYFKDQMPDIDPNCAESINSIEHRYPKLRSESKPITFRFQYLGGWQGLIKEYGFSAEFSQQAYNNYRTLYKDAFKWNDALIKKAAEQGYVTLAFGLRLRTPTLVNTVIGSKHLPPQVAADIRTVINAASGQSYCMLSERAGVDMQQRIIAQNLIGVVKPSIHVHDSLFFITKRDPEILKWLNDNLVDAISYQDLPEIRHDELKLTGESTLHMPSWCDSVPVRCNASVDDFTNLLKQ